MAGPEPLTLRMQVRFLLPEPLSLCSLRSLLKVGREVLTLSMLVRLQPPDPISNAFVAEE